MKIVFIILNYNTLQETIECIDSIKKHIDLCENEYRIVVTDNHSSDESGIILNNKYITDKVVDVIQTEMNYGFARGNNEGINYARKKYNPEFYAVLNSDVELFQDDLYMKLKKEYEFSKFGVLGPMICLANGRCDESPWEPININKVLHQIRIYENRIKYPYYISILIEKIRWHFNQKFGNNEFHVRKNFWKYQKDVELQGACLFFSRILIDKIRGFDNRTFLYYEEQLLYVHVKRAGFELIYDPRISVLHKDGSATRKLNLPNRVKYNFLNKCNLESLRILKSEYEIWLKK